MYNLIDYVLTFALIWASCGMCAYLLFDGVSNCFDEGDESSRRVLAILGPIGLLILLLMAAANAYFFVLGTLIEIAVRHWRRFLAICL